jgi:hypothetical protein
MYGICFTYFSVVGSFCAPWLHLSYSFSRNFQFFGYVSKSAAI